MLKVCELYLDRLTRIVANTFETKGIYPANKRRASTAFIKQAQRRNINQMVDQCESWLKLFEREIVTSSLHAQDTESGQAKDVEIQLRYFSARGRFAQFNEDIDRAYNWYIRCKSLLQKHPMSLDIKW
jgi:hypothetical protein